MISTGRALVVLLIAAGALVAGCRPRPEDAGPIRLVDLYKPEVVHDRATLPSPPPSVEWRFDKPAPAAPAGAKPAPAPGPGPAPVPAPVSALVPWQPGPGVADLAVRAGHLAGKATTDTPILALSRPASDDRDLLHEVHVRMRASAGANLSMVLRNTEGLDLPNEAALLRGIPWPFSAPLVAGSEMKTYVLRSTASLPAAARHVVLRPTDTAGATFEIESVRFVSRRQHLASVASGIGWQGLSDVYRETLVARAPETMRFRVPLPRAARLYLGLGTIEDLPVTFRVAVRAHRSGREETVLTRTITSPHRWEDASIDLSAYAGGDADVALSLASERPAALGFWGTPVIREIGPPPRARSTAKRPQGVILVWADTLRRDHLPFYGYNRPTAPALGRLAAEGTVFEDCIVQAPWTKASGPSLLTGLYPRSTGVQDFNDLLPSSAFTVAEAFREAGHATLGLVSIQFVGKFSNMHQGFEELHEASSFPERRAGSTKSARTEVDRLLAWLDVHRDVPFFVLLHVADPHSPFKPSAPYDTLFADASRREEHERQAREVKAAIKNPAMRGFGMPTREELTGAGIDPEAYVAYEKDWYDGSIRGMDAEIGRLAERLKELGLDDRTLLAFVSDHGEEFLEHGRTFHAQSVYGELSNVPFFLRGPGVPAGLRVKDTVRGIDLTPTLLDLAGVPLPKGLQGESVTALFNPSGHAQPRPAVMEKAARLGTEPGNEHESVAIVLDGWKLVHHRVRPPGRPEFQLFDHRTDPLDARDVAAQHPDVVARLTRELESWRRMADAARLKPDAQTAREVSGEELERLRALGYVQ